MTFGPLSFRDFSVQGVADPQQSLTQLESKGQGAEPVWSSHLSADSALSDGSTGSLEQHPDAGQQLTCDAAVCSCCGTSCFLSALSVPDTDSLSQGSSAGSLEDDRNSLKNHFETLASGLDEGSGPPRHRDL